MPGPIVDCARALCLAMISDVATRGRVLVIEDDAAVRSLVLDLLGAEGYDAQGAADGDAGLARLTAAPPDVVLLDLHTPGLPSDEFARAYRKRRGRAARIVLLSGDHEAELGRASECLGAQGWLAKPFNVEELLDLVARLLSPLAPQAPPAST